MDEKYVIGEGFWCNGFTFSVETGWIVRSMNGPVIFRRVQSEIHDDSRGCRLTTILFNDSTLNSRNPRMTDDDGSFFFTPISLALLGMVKG